MHMCRVGQNRIYTPYMTVYLVIFLPKKPYTHRVYMVLANPNISVFYNHIAIAQIPGLSILLEEPGGKASNLYFLPPNTLYFNAIT